MTTKIDLTNIADTALTTLTGPKITTIVYLGDDTATDTAGGQTINLTGNGFQSGCSVLVSGTASSVVTFISATQISFLAPALSAGTYVIYVINPDGGTAISIPGISYSGTPNWTTSAGSLGTAYETGAISATLTATGDAPITYTLASGTLPTGSTLNSNGTLSGTAVATASITTYSFTIKATDAQNQDTNRAFSLTINPDVVSWSSPANSTTYNVFTDSAIANVAMSATSAAGGSITYTADTLPTGLSITGANIAGTPTVAASTTTVLTATATSTRNATRTINWVVSVANDTYFKNTTLLLNGETTVTPFISDASTNSLALTIAGDTKPTLFNPYQGDGYYGAYFNGSTSLSTPSSSAFNFGTSDFTIEFWINAPSQAKFIYDNRGGSTSTNPHITLETTILRWGGTDLRGTRVIADNGWHHCAITRQSGTIKLWVDGVLDTSGADSTNYNTTQPVLIGNNSFGSSNLTGYLSNFRIVSTAVYTSAFTPPTSPLTAITNTQLLILQSNRFIDKSTNAFTLTPNSVQISPAIPFTANASYSTYGSTYFDGTGDYLTLPNSSSFAFGTGNFTIEFWVYAPAQGTTRTAFIGTDVSYGANFWTIQLNNTSPAYSSRVQLWCYNMNSAAVAVVGSTTLTASTWYHVAVVRNGTAITIYLNGTSDGTGTSSASLDGGVTQTINVAKNSTDYYTGYISDLRINKGTAVYTSAFTPPTTPLTAIANTSLLTLQYNGGANNSGIIDNSNFNNIVTRAGNASQGSFSPYSVTGWSLYTNGSSSYAYLPYSSTRSIGTGDFSIECWVYIAKQPANYTRVWSHQSNWGLSGSIGIELAFGTVDTLIQAIIDGNSTTYASATYDTSGTNGSGHVRQWIHAVASRQNGYLRLFVNGILREATANSTNINGTSTTSFGTNSQLGGDLTETYISNFRMCIGSVPTSYSTTNTTGGTTIFTPPTSPVTVTSQGASNVTLLLFQSNRFVDNSPYNFAITTVSSPSIQAFGPFGSISEATPISYSNYFNNGTTEYLSLTTTVFQHTADFTYECWVYWNGTVPSDWPMIFDTRPSNTSQSTSIACNLNPSTYRLNFYLGGTNYYWGATALPSNSWVHIAVVRSSGTVKIYQNGVLGTDTASNSSTFSGATGMRIGANIGNMGYWPGYISNFRVTNTAVYTATFTPSTTALTAIANTSLLTCQSTTIKDNSTNALTITVNGSPKVYNYNPFGYTAQSITTYTPSLHGGSAYFDGTGDYLTTPDSSTVGNFGTKSFTIEFWVYTTDAASVLIRQNATGTPNWGILITSGSIYWQNGYEASSLYYIALASLTTNPLVNAWTHIAITRNASNELKFWINGVGQSSVVTDTTDYNSTAGIKIGSGSYGEYTGYLSDIRIVKGTAVYTSNFVPPTQKLTNYSTTYPASLLLNFTNGGIIDQHSSNVLETVGNAQLSTGVKKYNVASIYLGGSGNYLQVSSTTNLDFGTGDFTIECWVYNISIAVNYPTFISSITGWSAGASGHRFNNTGYANKFWFGLNGSAGVASGDPFMASSNTFSFNTWYHYALTRSGNTWRMFVNGTLENTQTFSGSYNAAYGGMRLGYSTWDGANGWFNGYLDDVRFTKGYARYTANFTAPTSALITK